MCSCFATHPGYIELMNGLDIEMSDHVHALWPFWSSLQAYRDFSVRLKRTGIFLYVQNSPGSFLYVQKSTGSFLYVLTWPICDQQQKLADTFNRV